MGITAEKKIRGDDTWVWQLIENDLAFKYLWRAGFAGSNSAAAPLPAGPSRLCAALHKDGVVTRNPTRAVLLPAARADVFESLGRRSRRWCPECSLSGRSGAHGRGIKAHVLHISNTPDLTDEPVFYKGNAIS